MQNWSAHAGGPRALFHLEGWRSKEAGGLVDLRASAEQVLLLKPGPESEEHAFPAPESPHCLAARTATEAPPRDRPSRPNSQTFLDPHPAETWRSQWISSQRWTSWCS